MERNLVEYFRTSKTKHTISIALYYAGKEKCLPGHAFGPAIRAQYLLHFILSGKGSFYVNGRSYSLGANQVFIIKPGESTYYLADAQDPWEYMWFAFDGRDVTRILQDCGLLGDVPVSNYFLDTQLIAAFNDTLRQLEQKEENDYALMGNLYHIFAHLNRIRFVEEVEPSSKALQHALNFIRNNYRGEITIQDIAHYAQVERSHLYRLFISEFELSPKQYLTQYRLRSAKDLMGHSDLNTTEIAFECGFNDVSAFCRYFRKQYGFTPKHYRAIDGEKQLSFVSTMHEAEK